MRNIRRSDGAIGHQKPGQETESDAKDGQPSRLLQMFREAGDLGAEAMSLSDRRN